MQRGKKEGPPKQRYHQPPSPKGALDLAVSQGRASSENPALPGGWSLGTVGQVPSKEDSVSPMFPPVSLALLGI